LVENKLFFVVAEAIIRHKELYLFAYSVTVHNHESVTAIIIVIVLAFQKPAEQ
jgi:uncharacterized protein affecting Mg2+/Co2+ transport